MNSWFSYMGAFIAGIAVGLLVSVVLRDHSVAVSATGPRVEWCQVSSFTSTMYDNDPLGPLPTRWALDGYLPDGSRKTVATGETREEMSARANELGCPLRGAP